MSLYSILTSEPAWIGLFFNVKTGTLSWSSGPVFTTTFWFPSLSGLMPEFCALLKVIVMQTIPTAVTGHCLTPNAFICYYDPAIGHLNTEQYLPRDPTTPLSSDPSITLPPDRESPLSSSSVSLQSDESDTTFGPGDSTTSNCVTTIDWELSTAPEHMPPAASSEPTGSLSAVTSQASGTDNIASGASDPHLTTTSRPTTRLGSTQSQPESEPGSSSVTGKKVAETNQVLLASSEPPGSPLFPRGGDSTTSNRVTTTGQELSTAPGHMPPAASSEPTGSLSAVTSQASGTDNIAPGASDPHLTITSRPTTRLGSTQSQPEPEPGNGSVTGKKEGETSQGLLASSEPPGSPLFPRGGDSTTSNSMTVSGQELSTAPGHMPPAASSEPTGSLSAVTSQASGTDNIAPGASDPHLTTTSRPTTRLGPTQSQSELEPGSSSFTGKKVGGTSKGFLISSEPPGSPLFPRGGSSSGARKKISGISFLASSEPPESPLSPRGGDSTTSNRVTTTGQELSTAPGHMPPAASSEPTGSLSAVTSQASGTDNIASGASDPHLTITSRPTTRLGSTQSQPEPEPEQRFGILKADFNSPDILQSEARKEELLREIQEAVKAILGHEQFRLKWISFDENQS
ncbi:putative C-type lectin domain family 20 member A [Notamacropus eugenii]|uniref:putative C-type lectin domain family 20 member A n=1 Tax=Notamacropus eugenii TaxID=9315 RepID=UPI003B67E3D1